MNLISEYHEQIGQYIIPVLPMVNLSHIGNSMQILFHYFIFSQIPHMHIYIQYKGFSNITLVIAMVIHWL